MTATPLCRALRAGFVLICVVMLAACELSALGQQPPTQVYVLSTLADQPGSVAVASPVSDGPTFGVSTVSFPPYLERKEIVTRATDSQLVLHRFDKWGSAPDEDFARAMAADLRVLLPGRTFVNPPFRPETPLDYEVRFAIERFEQLGDGSVVLDARWVVWQVADSRALATRSTQIRIPGVGEPIPQVVAGMSEAVNQLSAQVAGDLESLRRRRPLG